MAPSIASLGLFSSKRFGGGFRRAAFGDVCGGGPPWGAGCSAAVGGYPSTTACPLFAVAVSTHRRGQYDLAVAAVSS